MTYTIFMKDGAGAYLIEDYRSRSAAEQAIGFLEARGYTLSQLVIKNFA